MRVFVAVVLPMFLFSCCFRCLDIHVKKPAIRTFRRPLPNKVPPTMKHPCQKLMAPTGLLRFGIRGSNANDVYGKRRFGPRACMAEQFLLHGLLFLREQSSGHRVWVLPTGRGLVRSASRLYRYLQCFIGVHRRSCRVPKCPTVLLLFGVSRAFSDFSLDLGSSGSSGQGWSAGNNSEILAKPHFRMMRVVIMRMKLNMVMSRKVQVQIISMLMMTIVIVMMKVLNDGRRWQ